jgi:hypothetical protein
LKTSVKSVNNYENGTLRTRSFGLRQERAEMLLLPFLCWQSRILKFCKQIRRKREGKLSSFSLRKKLFILLVGRKEGEKTKKIFP